MEKIIFTRGDDATLQIRIKRNDAYVNLTGYTFETYFRKADGTIFTVPNGDHTIVGDQTTDGDKGKLLVSIAAEDSALFKIGQTLTFITKVTNGSGKSVHYRGTGLLNIMDNEP